MKIAFDYQIFVSQQYGGVSRMHARLAHEMAQAGEDVRVVAPLYINAYLEELPRQLVCGRRIAPSRLATGIARRFNALANASLLAQFGPDIVQETYYAGNRAAPRRARVVLTVYDMIHELMPDSFPPDDPTAALKAAAVARADHIICISQSTQTDLVRILPAAAGKTSVVLLGFDPAVAQTEAPPPGAKPYLLYVGQRGGYKNFAGLLAAYADSPALRDDFDLLAVGGGGFSESETAVIGEHGLAGRVHQRPADDKALQGYYGGASVFIYPSLYEGFGIPPLEAMAAGTPVVAMRASSVPEVCGDAARYATPGDTDSLRREIEDLALSSANAAALAAAGTQRLQHFSWARTAADTLAVYRSLL